MTIKELILENDNFAKSEEAFEIYKESCELNVLNAWIECQEHKAFSGTSAFTEADDTALSAAKEKAEAKEEALHKKIWERIKNTAIRVWNAILKIINKILREFGVMHMPVLSKEQRENIFKRGELSDIIQDVISKIYTRYSNIPHHDTVNTTFMGDPGTRNIADKLAAENSPAMKKMAALQIAYFLTGQKEIIAPTIFTVKVNSKSKKVSHSNLYDSIMNNDISNLSIDKILGMNEPYHKYTIDDFEMVSKELNNMISEMNDSEVVQKKGLDPKTLDIVIKLLNRDLKIITTISLIESYLKELGDKLKHNNFIEEDKKFIVND